MVPKHERGSPSSTGQREAPAKRSRSPAKGPRVPPRAPASSSPYMSMFEGFRAELDEHQDRRERVIKSSRDVTAASKKMYLLSPAYIFSLQRAQHLNAPLSEGIRTEVRTRALAIGALLAPRLEDDLAGTNGHRYARQISPGIQELVEAAVFQRYLETQTLLSLEGTREMVIKIVRKPREEERRQQTAAAAKRNDTGSEEPITTGEGTDMDMGADADTNAEDEAAAALVSDEDWLLGVFDATGEMMRWAITAMALGGAVPGSSPSALTGDAPGSAGGRNMLSDVRELRALLEALNMRGSWLLKAASDKMRVMRASVEKVEGACYGLIVRGSERPKGWVPEGRDEGAWAEAVEGY